MTKLELEVQLAEQQTALGLIEDQKINARTLTISSAFGEFTAPEGLRVDAFERRIELQQLQENGYPHTLARLEIDREFNYDYTQQGYKASYRFNSGDNDQIQFLPAIADFITIASQKADVICKLFVDIDSAFKEKMLEAQKAVNATHGQISEINRAETQAKKDAILDLMKGDGFVPLRAKPNKEYGWVRGTDLQMKFDWTISAPSLIKIVGTSSSGKSVKVEVSRTLYDGKTVTGDVETIRMDNINRFITQELDLREHVEANLEEFIIAQGLLL